MKIEAGTRSADILGEFQLACRQTERLFHGVYDTVCRAGRRIRPEIPPAAVNALVCQLYFRPWRVGELDIRIIGAVLQLDVEARHILLDELIFEYQRFKLRFCVIHFKIINAFDHALCLGRMLCRRHEIAADAVFQRL